MATTTKTAKAAPKPAAKNDKATKPATTKPAAQVEEEEEATPYVEVHIDLIRVQKDFNRRKDFGDLDELAKSIKEHNNGQMAGVKQPLRVRPDGKGKYFLIDGERRYKGAQIARGTKADYYLPCMEVPADYEEQDALLDQIIMNNDGKPLTMFEESEVYSTLQAAPYSMKAADIARKVGKSATHIGNCLYLSTKATPAIKKQIAEGLITGTAAVELLKKGVDAADLVKATKKASEEKVEKKVAKKATAKPGSKAAAKKPADKKTVSTKEVAKKLEKPVAGLKKAEEKPAAEPASKYAGYTELLALKKELQVEIAEENQDEKAFETLDAILVWMKGKMAKKGIIPYFTSDEG